MLDVPARQFSHCSFGGVLPLVPAGQAVNPDSSLALMRDPVGTTTTVDPSPATTCPFDISMQEVALDSG